MSDSYQAIYDAVRSRISNGDVGAAVSDAAFRQFDISWLTGQAQGVLSNIEIAYTRPHAVMRPNLFMDGNQWCAMYGQNIQDGVAGFGDSPVAAMQDFDANWIKAKEVTP